MTMFNCGKHGLTPGTWCHSCEHDKTARRSARAAADDALSEAGLGVPLDVAKINDRYVRLNVQTSSSPSFGAPASGGGKLTGDHYYRVQVAEPMSPELQPYSAECADIIEALGMTFNEGEAFKALWRLAAGRQGRGKAGGKPQYDADKVAHYGARVAVQTKKAGAT